MLALCVEHSEVSMLKMIPFLSALPRDKEAQQIPLALRAICPSYLEMSLWTKVASAY